MQSAAPQAHEGVQSQLLALPEPLLLAVLQCLAAAGDQCSLFSAARAHSRLHQAAVAVLGSITVGDMQWDQQLDGVLLYLSKHTQHVSSLSLAGNEEYMFLTLRQLPSPLQLHSLELHHMHLRLGPGGGFRGVLGYDGLSALKQLRLCHCELQDEDWDLQAALAQLPPTLQHLSMVGVCLNGGDGSHVTFATELLQQRLTQLTHLDFTGVAMFGPDPEAVGGSALQPLQALSRLADLRLLGSWDGDGQHAVLTAGVLPGATGLTRLELRWLGLEPAALAGKTQLQHLDLAANWQCEVLQGADWTAQLLSQLMSLQQLTHLGLSSLSQAASPATAFSALTASSRLQHLGLSDCTLPAGVWQHVFPAGRQLPQLTSLEVACAQQPPAGPCQTVPEGSRLVSCCPGLRRLDVSGLVSSAGAFGPLSALSGLHALTVSPLDAGEAVREVCQLTGLRELSVSAWQHRVGLVRQVTQLRQLTRLTFYGPHNFAHLSSVWVAQDPADEPVWRQMLRAHLDHRDPAVAQAAAAGLADAE